MNKIKRYTKKIYSLKSTKEKYFHIKSHNLLNTRLHLIREGKGLLDRSELMCGVKICACYKLNIKPKKKTLNVCCCKINNLTEVE